MLFAGVKQLKYRERFPLSHLPAEWKEVAREARWEDETRAKLMSEQNYREEGMDTERKDLLYSMYSKVRSYVVRR